MSEIQLEIGKTYIFKKINAYHTFKAKVIEITKHTIFYHDLDSDLKFREYVGNVNHSDYRAVEQIPDENDEGAGGVIVGYCNRYPEMKLSGVYKTFEEAKKWANKHCIETVKLVTIKKAY